MFSSSDSISFAEGLFKPSYGPSGEEHIRKTIQLLKLWNQKKYEINNVSFDIIEGDIHNYEDRDDVLIKFKLSDLEGNSIILFKDSIFDDILTIEYKKPTDSFYNEVPLFTKDLENNYILKFNNYRNERDKPLNELEFIFYIKLPKFENRWNYSLIAD